MRIKNGKYKNRAINIKKIDVNLQKQIGLHPTKSKVKQAIFNILQHANYLPENFLQNAMIMDICCGSGSYGIEALSLNAKFVLFIDNNVQVINTLKKNVERVGISQDQYTILQTNAITMHERIETHYIEEFNLVFIDLPYKDSQNIERILNTLSDKKWIKKDCLVIAEITKKTSLPYHIQYTRIPKKLSVLENKKVAIVKLPKKAHAKNDIINKTFTIIDERVYGRTRIVILKYNSNVLYKNVTL